jgi:hypothetical protein
MSSSPATVTVVPVGPHDPLADFDAGQLSPANDDEHLLDEIELAKERRAGAA